MTLNDYSSIMTVEETMEYLKIGKGKCYELLKTGKIRAFRIGNRTWKIPKESLEYFLNSKDA